MKILSLLSFIAAASNCVALSDTTIVRGSYRYYGAAAIEDNSMFVDEALNQNSGSLQFVSSLLTRKNFAEYQFEVEIPLAGEEHQMSFDLPVTIHSFQSTPRDGATGFQVGDLQITYRPLLFGRNKWCLLAPSISILLPVTDLGVGAKHGPGAALKLAMTKRTSTNVTTHLNLAGSWMLQRGSAQGEPLLQGPPEEKVLSVASGIVFSISRKANLMLEQCYNRGLEQSMDNKRVFREFTISPAVRFAFNAGSTQLVPAFGFPADFSDGAFHGFDAFIYLSIETGN
ncbi:MAG TPA: hypothetical protein VGD40_22720 [Chryseosolibacter sp.]